MAPFTFPDPSVSTSVVNPKTGELWIYVDGVWMVDDTEDAPLPTPDPSPTPTPTVPDGRDNPTSYGNRSFTGGYN